MEEAKVDKHIHYPDFNSSFKNEVYEKMYKASIDDHVSYWKNEATKV